MTNNTSAIAHFRTAIWKKKSVFLEAMIVTIVVNLIGLATAMYSMQVYDRVIPNNGLDTLYVLTIGVLLAVIIDLILKQSRSMLVDKASKDIDTELSAIFFGHAMNIRMDKRPATVGTFASQIRAFEFVRQFLTSTTLFMLADIPFALIFIGVIFVIAGPLSLIPLLLLPATILVGVMFIIPIAKLSMANAHESNVKNGLLIESIDGIESIKSLQGQSLFQDRWVSLTKLIGDNELKIKKWTALSSHLSQFIQQLSYIGLVAFGVYQITKGDLTMGGLIAVTIISGRALSPLAQTANVIVQWQQAKAALVGLDSMMQTQVDGDNSVINGMPLIAPDHCRGDLEIKGVVFGYDPQFPALRIPRLLVNKGSRVAIVGGIGSGKSTLLKLLSGLFLPNEGRVFIDSVDTAHLEPNFMRQHIYYLPQNIQLFNGTLKDNLLLGLENLDISDSDLLASAELTGLQALISAHPRGLGLLITEGGRGLSGGQQQLVALTQLVLRIKRHPPRLLLLDEPTSALDGATEMNVMKLLVGLLPEDCSLIFVTHKFSQLNYAERIMVMDKSSIIADGAKADILPKLSGAKS